MEFYAARLAAAPRATPGPAWGRVERGAAGWAPPGGGERRNLLPPRPPLHGAASSRRCEARAEGRGGGVRNQRAPGAGAESGTAGEGSAGGARGVPRSVVVAREIGEIVGTKRQLPEPPAYHPPSNRPAVSARRQFQPGCGRDAAAPLGRADDIPHAMDNAAAAPRPPLALPGCNAVALPGTESLSSASASGGLNNVSAADGAGPVAKDGHHVPAARTLAKQRIVSANRSFPPGCGRDAVPLLAVEMRLMLDSDRGLGVPKDMVADVDCSAADEGGMEFVVATPSGGATDGAVQDEELEEGEIPPAKVHPMVQEHLGPQISVNVTLEQPAACGQGAFVQAIGAVEASVSPSSDEKTTSGGRIQCGKKMLSCEVAKDFKVMNSYTWSPCHVAAEPLSKGEVAQDFKVMNSCAWSSCHVAAESLSEEPSQEQLKGNRVSEIAKMEKASPDFAEEIPKMEKASPDFTEEIPKMDKASSDFAVEIPKVGKASSDFAVRESGEGATLRSKLMLTPRKTVRPPKVIKISAADTQHAPLSENKERDNELGKHVTTNQIEDIGQFTKNLVKQALTSSVKRAMTHGKESATVAGYFGPRKRVKVKNPANLPVNLNPKCELGTKKKLDDTADSNLDDDDLLKGLAVHEGKLEFYFKDSLPDRRKKCQRQYGIQNADVRSKVKMMCRRFEIICRTIAQAVTQRCLKVMRIDLAADKAMKELPDFSKSGPFVGNVPGVEVGDGFLYRVQLAIVGLHRPYQGGIDWTKDNSDNLIAISVVASGGYPDELSSAGELVYTGSGGKLAGRNASGDQKLERGNIALKNCIKRKSPVRVIHGFKGQNNEEDNHSRAKEITTFTYDGLYHVVDCWSEGQPGSKVFKYRLQRIPGQRELPHGRNTGIMI